MKRVVSVSIGSSRRNHTVETTIGNETFEIQRIGTDGSLARAEELIRELDGKVAAFGLGGIDRYLYAGGRRYTVRDAERLARAARISPVADGSGLKQSLERKVVRLFADDPRVRLRGRPVLLVSAVDRFGMAEAFHEIGSPLCLGDLPFALGIPFPLRSLRTLRILAALVLPVITWLPFQWIYPTGERQSANTPRFPRFFEEVEVVAGDFLYIYRYMPVRMDGKIVLTNTVTREDKEELRRRGVGWLITTTPELNGRSFGTNVIEALLLALTGKRSGELSGDQYLELLEGIGFQPRIENLQVEGRQGGAGGAGAGADSTAAVSRPPGAPSSTSKDGPAGASAEVLVAATGDRKKETGN